MHYTLTETEYAALVSARDQLDKMRAVAEDKERRLTEIGLALHKLLGTTHPPTRVNGTGCMLLVNQLAVTKLGATKDLIAAAISDIEAGVGYARECLRVHDMTLGRATDKNGDIASIMEFYIENAERTISELRALPPQ